MRGYFIPRTPRGRALLAAYVLVTALLGLVAYTAAYPLGHAAQVCAWLLLVPMVIATIPVMNAVEIHLFSAGVASGHSLALAAAVVFGLSALANGCGFTYLRSSDGRY